MIKIWHNNRCSKSREAKKILEDSGLEFEVFEYLKNDFTIDDIKDIKNMLGISDIRDMLRKKEKEYSELDIDNKLEDEILTILLDTPKLIERPIIIKENRAVIARPMENLTNLLENS